MLNKDTISKIILMFSDFLSLILSQLLGIYIIIFGVNHVEHDIPISELEQRILIHFFISVLCIGWFWVRLRHYSYRKPFWLELKEILRTLLILGVIELAIIAFSKLYLSRFLWFLTWGITLLVTPFVRVLVKKILIQLDLYLRDAIIIGGRENAMEAYKALMSEKYLGFRIRCFITKNYIDDLKKLGIPIISESKKYIYQLPSQKNNQFIIALEDDEIELRDYWLRFFSTNGYRSVSVIPTLRGLPLYSTNMSFLFSHEVILLRVNNNLAKRSSRILKRMMDILGSLAIMIILSPVLFVLYFMIKKDGGNAIYGHERIGRNGKIFKCLKFRSMVVNSKEVLEELLAKDPTARAEWEKDFKLKNDPRITRVGHFIRKTSLDELPQLFNVLKGEMSLVGPRPIVKEELERYEENVDYYLMAKPGMTGLWQVSGRNDVDYKTRVYFDSWYVKNWSLWNDIAILFKTISVVLNRSGAY